LVISPNHAPSINETGEFTIVIGPANAGQVSVDDDAVVAMFCRITNIGGFDESSAIRLTSAATSLKTATVRKLVKKSKISAERQSRPVS
jgi:hypothetical protein